MLFTSKLIRKHLLKVPGQNQIANGINYATGDTSAYGIVVDGLTEGSIHFNTFCIKHGFEAENKGAVWDDRDGVIDWERGVVRIWGHEGYDVLNKKEQKRDDYSKFRPREESLNEKTLNNNDQVEKDKYKEGHYKFDVGKRPSNYYAANQMDDQQCNEVSYEPRDIVNR